MFKILDTLHPTATGLESIPSPSLVSAFSSSRILQASNSSVQPVYLYTHTIPEGFSTTAFSDVCVFQNYLIWLNLLKQPMTNCSSWPSRTITFCLVFYSDNWKSL